MAQTCPACGAQFGGKREPQRVDRKSALAANDKLRPVQWDILWNLYRLRLMSQSQIADAFFTAKDVGNRKNAAKNNLNHLENLGLIRRLDGDKRQHFRAYYTPTREGIFLCQAEQKDGAGKVKKIRDLKPEDLIDSQKWQHHHFVTDVMTSFLSAERRGEGELIDYYGDGELRFVFPFMGSTRRLQPDATVVWSNGNRAQLSFLELENKHSSLADIEEKVKKYLWMESAGNQRGDYFRRTLAVNQFPPLLIVAVRRGQLDGLRQAIVKGILGSGCGTLPEVSRRVVIGLSCLDDVKDIGILGPAWEKVAQGTGRLHVFADLYASSLDSRP